MPRSWRKIMTGLVLLWVVHSTFGSREGRAQEPRTGLPPGSIGASALDIFTAETSSTEGALRILLPTGARAVGMGRAVTALQGSESAFWNPAGLARIQEGRFVVLRGTPLVGEATAFSLLLAKQPLGVLAVSYQFLDMGDQDLTDKDNNILGSVSFRDHLGIVSFATQILPRLDGGVNFKVFSTRATCRGLCSTSGVSGTTYSLDLGVQAEPVATLPLRLAFMVAHLGPNLQIINVEQADPLPTRMRVAGAYEILRHFTELPLLELWMTAELEDRLFDLGSPVLYLGSEFAAGEEDQIFVRAGYGQSQAGQAAGASVGLGLRYQQFEMGIAKSLSSTSLSGSSEPIHITFGVIF